MSFNGALTRGTPTFAAGKFGNALAGAVYTVGAVGSPTVGTLEVWAKTTSAATIVAVGDATTNSPWIGANGSTAAFQAPGVVGFSNTSVVVNDGAWHHLALTLDGTNAKFWVDGVLASTVACTLGLITDSHLAIGGFDTPSDFDWPGQIDEVRLSNVVRYTTNTFTVPTAAFTDDANTLALYHLDTDATDSHATTGTVPAGTIAPNDANIVYSPYTWEVTATRAKTINAGAYLSCLFTGTATSITANFDLSNTSAPAPQIGYRIDSGPWTPVTVAATVTLPVPSTNAWTKHLVELRVKSTSETVNRWASPQNTAVVFTGFTVTPTTVTTGPVRKKRFTILCYGDSIAEGVRALGSTQTNDTDRNDSALAWAYPLGALLGAEIGVVGFGGTGLTGAGSGGVPALPSSYNLLWAGTSRLFTPGPDVILINAGTNDSGDVTAAATTFLNRLLAAATAKIAVVQQWNGTSHATQWQAAIAACTAPSRVSYIDTSGWWSSSDSSDGVHPYGYVNVADLAPRLAAAVGPLLPNGRRFLNKAGVAVAI